MIKRFELHHKITYFLFVFIATIIITRVLVLFVDPNPVIRGYELHHFYYGIAMLILACLLSIFINLKIRVFIFLSAVSIGLIADEFIYVLGGAGSHQIYLDSLPSVIVFSIIILALVLIIQFFKKKSV